jgi:predicted small metal-binding protein
MKTVTCRDAGFDCSAVIQGETEDEIMRKAEEHAMKEHNMKSEDITPEMRQKIKGVIHTT